MKLDASRLLALEFLPVDSRETILQKLPFVTLLLLVVILAYQLASFSWILLSGVINKDETAVPVGSGLVSLAGRSPETVNVSSLAAMHLFGQAQTASIAKPLPVTAPETRLNLVLYGVFTDADTKQGSAIIGQKGGEQKFYHVNDAVDNGVSLAEVRNDHVLLKRGVNYEVLKFPKQVSSGVDIQSRTRASATPVPSIVNQKQSFMENIKIIPVFAGKDRALKGYRLLPKKNRAVYNRMGIRPTDIVTAINGIKLSNQEEAMKVIAELVKSDSVEVQVERNGQTETRVLKLN
jgi:general secretion pathway protein C